MQENSLHYRLVLVTDGTKQAGYLLAVPNIAIGRDHDNLIQVSDIFVSRHHAVLVRNCQGYIVRDLDSRNRTFVNDAPVTERPLQPGDRLRFGPVEFQYEAVTEAIQLEELTGQKPTAGNEIATVREHSAKEQREAANRLARANAEREKLEADLAAARQQLDEQRQKHKQTENALKAQVAKGESEHDQVAAELAATQQALAELRSVTPSVEELNKKIATLGDELAAARTAVTVAQAEVAAGGEELTRCQSVFLGIAKEVQQVLRKFGWRISARKLTAREREELTQRLTQVVTTLTETQRRQIVKCKATGRGAASQRDDHSTTQASESATGEAGQPSEFRDLDHIPSGG
jgi:pSer/pThr/pTyr-binding forkhead associated (FHA) protein